MHEKQIANVLELPNEKKLRYVVKKAVDTELIWSLSDDDGWVSFSTDDGVEALPIWPAPEFAKMCAIEEWSDTQPESIDLEEWLEGWTPDLIRDKRLVAIFPGANNKGMLMQPAELAEAIRDLDDEYYG
jgi:hypothetical protein